MADRDLAEDLTGWREPDAPTDLRLAGRHVALTPMTSAEHAEPLFNAFRTDREGRIWDYLPYGPFDTLDGFKDWVKNFEGKKDPYFFAIERLDRNLVCGVASFLRISPKDGSIEVGHINFSPLLQKTVAATEAMYLMMKWAFEAGYRRYEWKCNALNAGSRRAAQRLGLSYEGIFRHATVVKGRNRDTAWFAAIDKEWPALSRAFEAYLSPDNFGADGKQKVPLSSLTEPLLHIKDPVLAG
ncbi:GNAT family N-acetyltransferase [Roseibium aggregatum]|uniref:GNAT family N-acetyltransferase n=1 Tax=Roseibium aggregatum TaxID=187304 RepID=A0A926S5D5_9HYPH|nr:GNAT family protein [Roseibium aggregatum]MBD1546366.1 GNAT family N-acetyltransferase [Roseibium aggregatum]